MRVRSPAFWVYGADLLSLADHERPASELIAARDRVVAQGVSLATSYEWERLLVHHRVIVGAGRRRVDPDRLLQIFTWMRGAQLGAPQRFATGDGPDRISRTLAEAGIPHAFGAITAANHWSFYEPAPSIQVYVPPRAVGITRRLLDQGGRSIRGEIYGDAPDHLVVSGADLDRIEAACRRHGNAPAYRAEDLRARGGAPFPVTSRFLALVDCRVHPEGASHAAFLQDLLLSRPAP